MSAYTDVLRQAAFTAYENGRHDEAEASLRLILSSAGSDAHAIYFIGHLRYLRGQLEEAMLYLKASLNIDPTNARAHNDLGETLRALGRREEAIPYLERAIALEPTLGHAYGNLAAALVDLGRPEDALRWAQASLWYATDKAVAHCDLGSALGRLNRTREAIRQFELALAIQPELVRPRFYASMMRLSLGQMPDAWPDYELRLALPGAPGIRENRPQPRWQGDNNIAGQTILLHAEQGLGDTIQFVRYAPLVAAMGAIVRLEVPTSMVPLLKNMPAVASVHAEDASLPPFDLQCALMSLPAAFRTSLADIPADIPYLRPDPARRAAWEQRLGPWTRMRIGLAWSGNPRGDLRRSVPLAELLPLLSHGEVEFHSVQRDVREQDYPALSSAPLRDHGSLLTDFSETAALMSLMDLVISIDSAPAHLAGALGLPAWVLLPFSPDWRWLRERGDSPWYPTMRLFRQPRQGGWQPVLASIGHQLDQWSRPQ